MSCSCCSRLLSVIVLGGAFIALHGGMSVLNSPAADAAYSTPWTCLANGNASNPVPPSVTTRLFEEETPDNFVLIGSPVTGITTTWGYWSTNHGTITGLGSYKLTAVTNPATGFPEVTSNEFTIVP